MVATGNAMPSWVEPQLATLTRDRFSDPSWIYERKLDGERCLAFAGPGGVRLLSRSEHEITTTFPEVAQAVAAQRHGGLVVDGEVVAFDGAQTRFELLQLPAHGVHWVTPELVGQVGFSEWTDDGQLRHPRFQGLRDDKKPAEVVREVPA